MERWEHIKRYVLLFVMASLMGTSAWLFFSRDGLGALLGVVPLPFAFWAFWQALYEGRMTKGKPPTAGERVAALIWLWFRRITVGSVGVVFAFASFALAQSAVTTSEFGAVAVLLLLSVMAFWVAFFGGGRQRSMSDDLRVHVERKTRYKWRL